jgi:hypothetical protein
MDWLFKIREIRVIRGVFSVPGIAPGFWQRSGKARYKNANTRLVVPI